jgi:hypothetical protein
MLFQYWQIKELCEKAGFSYQTGQESGEALSLN